MVSNHPTGPAGGEGEGSDEDIQTRKPPQMAPQVGDGAARGGHAPPELLKLRHQEGESPAGGDEEGDGEDPDAELQNQHRPQLLLLLLRRRQSCCSSPGANESFKTDCIGQCHSPPVTLPSPSSTTTTIKISDGVLDDW